jgi:CheY-like chemotaxis protein
MPTKKVDILIVEDELSLRLSLAEIFMQTGREVRSASDGFSALRELRHKTPDILLSDLNMPGMSGFELLSVVRRRFPGAQVIAMSGAYAGNGIPTGVAADAFYQKGTDLRALLRLVQAMSEPEWGQAHYHRSTQAPIWIVRNDRWRSGMQDVTITCPECLRAFPHLAGSAVPIIQEVACTYCSTVIPYAVVEPAEMGSGEAVMPAVRPEIPMPAEERRGLSDGND